MGLLLSFFISWGFGSYKRCLKCWNLELSTTKISCFLKIVFLCHISSWNWLNCKCHECGNSFKMKCYIRQIFLKSTWFFDSKFKISIFYKMQNFKKLQKTAVIPFLRRNLKISIPNLYRQLTAIFPNMLHLGIFDVGISVLKH